VTDALDPVPPDQLTRAIVRALDVAVLEWTPGFSCRPLCPTPEWFAAQEPWSSLPFLEDFGVEAARVLREDPGRVAMSDQFTVPTEGEELLLRARAFDVDGRLVLAIERLHGAADVRPILRNAREQMLEYETLADKARALHTPMAAAVEALERLKACGLSESQRTVADALGGSLARLQEAAAALPPPRKRR
jgi:hypothetical protein